MSTLTDYAGRLFIDMKEKLAQAESSAESLLCRLSKAIAICNDELKQLNDFASKTRFASPAEEINFFKNIKPPFVAELVYHAKLYQIHLCWPPGEDSQHREYLRRSLMYFQQFYMDNFSFMLYWRTESVDRDAEYFIRNDNPSYEFLSLPFQIKGDALSTGYDCLVACTLAFDRLIETVKEMLAAPGTSGHVPAASIPGKTTWTDDKVGLVELAYSIVEKGSCNNGKATLAAVIAALQLAFNVSIGQYSRTWIAIRRRKSDRPSFLEKLLQCFKRCLDRDDE